MHLENIIFFESWCIFQLISFHAKQNAILKMQFVMLKFICHFGSRICGKDCVNSTKFDANFMKHYREKHTNDNIVKPVNLRWISERWKHEKHVLKSSNMITIVVLCKKGAFIINTWWFIRILEPNEITFYVLRLIPFTCFIRKVLHFKYCVWLECKLKTEPYEKRS